MSISRQRLEEIHNIPDFAINTSDIPELDDNFWQTAKMVTPITKKAVYVGQQSPVALNVVNVRNWQSKLVDYWRSPF